MGAVPLWVSDGVAETPLLFSFQAAVAVGLAMFVMAATDTKHLPAAGTALTVASTGLTGQLALFLSTSVVALSLIHVALRSRLRNLY